MRITAVILLFFAGFYLSAQHPFSTITTDLKTAVKNPETTYHLKLENVWLSEKDIDKIALLKNLQTLTLIDNSLDSFPRVWCSLSRLMELKIINNPIKILPPEFVNIYNLRKLTLQQTALDSLPFPFSYL